MICRWILLPFTCVHTATHSIRRKCRLRASNTVSLPHRTPLPTARRDTFVQNLNAQFYVVYWIAEHVLYRRRTAIAHSTLCTVHTMRNTHTHTRAITPHEIHGRECMKSRVFSDCGGDSGRFGRDFARRRQFECGPHGETTCNTDASTSRATQGQRTHMHAASGRSQTVWLTIDNIKTTFISSILVYERAIFSATLHCNTTSSMKRYDAHTDADYFLREH